MNRRSSNRSGWGIALLASLMLSACSQIEPTPVPDEIGPHVACGSIAFGGFPKYAAIGTELSASDRPWPTYFICREGEYAMEFDPNFRVARWTMAVVDPAKWQGEPAKRRNDLRPDPLLPPEMRSTPEHWVGDTYGRMQLQPAAFVDNDEIALSHTFYTSTHLPVDTRAFDASSRLNDNIRAWAASRGPLIIVSGPIFDANQPMAWIGEPTEGSDPNMQPRWRGQMGVPSFIFRVILDPKTGQSTSFVLPNGPLAIKQLPSRRVSLTQVEQWAGMTLFPRLDPGAAAKIRAPASANPAHWPLR